MKFVDGIVITEIDNKKVAICTGDSTNVFTGFINLNSTGYEIWKYIEDGLDEKAIAEKLAKEYEDLDYEEALKHAKEFISNLKQKGILID